MEADPAFDAGFKVQPSEAVVSPFFFCMTGSDTVARLRIVVRLELLGIEAGAGYE